VVGDFSSFASLGFWVGLCGLQMCKNAGGKKKSFLWVGKN